MRLRDKSKSNGHRQCKEACILVYRLPWAVPLVISISVYLGTARARIPDDVSTIRSFYCIRGMPVQLWAVTLEAKAESFQNDCRLMMFVSAFYFLPCTQCTFCVWSIRNRKLRNTSNQLPTTVSCHGGTQVGQFLCSITSVLYRLVDSFRAT